MLEARGPLEKPIPKSGVLSQGFHFTGRFTLPETNITSENGWLADEFPFGTAYFGRYVSFRECICFSFIQDLFRDRVGYLF